jgi:hypothetical protein
MFLQENLPFSINNGHSDNSYCTGKRLRFRPDGRDRF